MLPYPFELYILRKRDIDLFIAAIFGDLKIPRDTFFFKEVNIFVKKACITLNKNFNKKQNRKTTWNHFWTDINVWLISVSKETNQAAGYPTFIESQPKCIKLYYLSSGSKVKYSQKHWPWAHLHNFSPPKFGFSLMTWGGPIPYWTLINLIFGNISSWGF